MVEIRTESAVTPARRRAPRRSDAGSWLVLRVVLRGQASEQLEAPPGRDLLVHTARTFAEIAMAIDRAFARWDISHLHEFQLADGRRIAAADDEDFEDGDLDEATETLGRLGAAVGMSFEYVFDLGADWQHECTIVRDVDPLVEAGIVPTDIVPIFGWGAIPDQYGRITPESDA